MKQEGEGECKEFNLWTGGLGHWFSTQFSCFWLCEMDQTNFFSWPVVSSTVLFLVCSDYRRNLSQVFLSQWLRSTEHLWVQPQHKEDLLFSAVFCSITIYDTGVFIGDVTMTPDWHVAILFHNLETTSPFINEVQCFCIKWTKSLYCSKCYLMSGWLLFLRLKGSVEMTVEAIFFWLVASIIGEGVNINTVEFRMFRENNISFVLGFCSSTHSCTPRLDRDCAPVLVANIGAAQLIGSGQFN